MRGCRWWHSGVGRAAWHKVRVSVGIVLVSQLPSAVKLVAELINLTLKMFELVLVRRDQILAGPALMPVRYSGEVT